MSAELLISRTLRIGVLLCLFVIAVGLLARFVQPGNAESVQALMTGQGVDFRPPVSLSSLSAGLGARDADTVIALGLILLIALPILRVALTILIFLRERDWAFFLITAAVLGVLLTGIFLG